LPIATDPWRDVHALRTRATGPRGPASWYCRVPPGHTAHPARVARGEMRVAPQLIIAGDPAVRHLLPPRVEHLQALFLPCLIAYFQRHMACLASLLVSCPVLGQRQAEVQQGMVVARDVAHEDPDLAVVHLAPVAAPL